MKGLPYLRDTTQVLQELDVLNQNILEAQGKEQLQRLFVDVVLCLAELYALNTVLRLSAKASHSEKVCITFSDLVISDYITKVIFLYKNNTGRHFYELSYSCSEILALVSRFFLESTDTDINLLLKTRQNERNKKEKS
ncbi:hypothetical protein [Flammeovirga agarivorans]|uniref:Uncharacterized protein n=1 Tax=Flammeovirga agarivorans TaxID=2726742 RepID=A0A7X8SR62_9BACT|nr:hypothetical protein [Flammeovirga agarivorans]NLR94890.1 hypothetical protein [Flammeovirga agarivorans]